MRIKRGAAACWRHKLRGAVHIEADALSHYAPAGGFALTTQFGDTDNNTALYAQKQRKLEGACKPNAAL